MLRAIPLWSEALGLTGRADVVEVHDDDTVVPVEYKAGTRHGKAADLQLCAQALCLEEMLSIAIDHGYIWFGGTRRRAKVTFDAALRTETIAAISNIRANLQAAHLPEAPNDQRCSQCQLLHYCLPEVVTIDSNWLERTTSDELYQCGT